MRFGYSGEGRVRRRKGRREIHHFLLKGVTGVEERREEKWGREAKGRGRV